MAESETEAVKIVNELINAQADQLWTIAISVIVAEIFMIAHLISLRHVALSQRAVAWVLSLSVLSQILSLTFGYLSKGALIHATIVLARNKEWAFPESAELFNLLQVICVTIGLVIFVVCFFFYSRVLAQAITATRS
jgi:hypothetical protein